MAQASSGTTESGLLAKALAEPLHRQTSKGRKVLYAVLAIAVLCCPPAVPSCQCVVVSVLLSSARCVCDLLPPARHNQIPTVKPLTVRLSRTKKFSNFFQSILAHHEANSVPRPCAPCSPSARRAVSGALDARTRTARVQGARTRGGRI